MDTPSLLRLLGDDTRLRILRLLSAEALNVSELTMALGVAQSGISRHLRLLREAGLVAEERSGTFAWYRTIRTPDGPLEPLWTWLAGEIARETPRTRADDARLAEVRRLRRENASRHAAGEQPRQLVPGRSWPAWSRALGLLLPPLDVADLGCGEGFLTLEVARWARHVTAVDRSAEVIARARQIARRRRSRNIRWKRGELEKLPLGDGTVDLALLSQALHHATDPSRALAETHRVLRPGGKVLVLDLDAHEETWVRQTLGDRWLGFTRDQLSDLLEAAGFTDLASDRATSPAGDPFNVVIARGTK